MISSITELRSFPSTSKTLETFDIRNFADRLTAKDGRNRYECPCCNGTLTIDPKTGKYNCWGEDCKKADIREAIRPLDEALREAGIEPVEFTPKPRKFTPKPAIPKAATIPVGEIKLGTLPSPVHEPARIQRGRNIEIVYRYSETQHVLRIQKPDGSKVTIPKCLDSNDNLISGKGSELWEPYRFSEIAEHGKGKWVLQVEGEKCVDAARSHLQLLSFTFQGSCWGEKDLIRYFHILKDAGITGVIYWADHDKAGYAKAKKCALAAAKVGLPFIEINPIRLWSDCPDGGDIADWIKFGLTNIEALQQEINQCANESRGQSTASAVAHVEKLNQKVLEDKAADYLRCKAMRERLTQINGVSCTTVNVSHMREVPQDILFKKGEITIIISPPGTGKTENMKPYAEDAEYVHSWHNRNSLAIAMAESLGLTHKDNEGKYSSKKKVGFCSPSSINHNPKDLSRGNTILLIDEGDQVFDFHFSMPCNRDGIRPQILESLEASIKIAMNNPNGKVVIMSSDITQKEINYLTKIHPHLNIIINEYKAPKPPISFDMSSSPEGQLKRLIEKLDNEIPCFVLDDIKNGIKGCKSIAQYIKKNRPHLADRVLVIHAENITKPEVKAFFENVNEESKKYLLIICSPSVISGISLTNQRFNNGVFAFCNGILIDTEIKQFFNRIRGANEINLWVAERGFPERSIPSNLLEPEEFREYYKHNYQINSKHILSYKAEYEVMTDEFTSPHFELYIDNLAYKTATKRHLRQFTREHLEALGYPIIEIQPIAKDEAKAIREGLTLSWNGIELNEALAIENADFLSDAQMEAIDFRGEEIPENLRPGYWKTRYRETFGEELINTLEYEHKKTNQKLTGYAAVAMLNRNGRFKSQLDNFYLLIQGMDEAAAKDYSIEARQIKTSGKRFAGDILWNARKYKCREWLGIGDLLGRADEWLHPDDYQGILDKLKSSTEAQAVLNISTGKKTDGQIIGEIFHQIGLKFETKEVSGKKYKLRKISADSLSIAYLYLEYLAGRQALKSSFETVEVAKPVETEIAKPVELEMANPVETEQIQSLIPGIPMQPLTWRDRLERALIMGEAVAKNVYQSIPLDLFDDIWRSLNSGLKMRYIELFT